WPADVPAWFSREHWAPLAIVDYGNQTFYTSERDPRCLLTANIAFRREVFDRIAGFAVDFPRCQDHELLVRMWRAGGRAMYAPELVVGAIIPADRLTRRYHLQWHLAHGHFSAQMRNEELLALEGGLRPEPLTGTFLFGVPSHVFAELPRALRRAARLRLGGDFPGALAQWYHAVYLAAYIRRTVALHRPSGRQVVADPIRFAVAHLRRHAKRIGMSPARLTAVYFLLTLLIGGSLYDIKTGREHWPLSPYPMFSGIEREASLRC